MEVLPPALAIHFCGFGDIHLTLAIADNVVPVAVVIINVIVVVIVVIVVVIVGSS